MSASYSHRDIQDWLSTLDDEHGRFAGFELRIGRIAGLLAKAHARGALTDSEAEMGLGDLYAVASLVKVGRKWGAWLRRPPMEVEILVSLGPKEA